MEIKTHYTGGGITLAEVDINAEQYAVVSTEALECLAIYNKVEDDEPYMPENMAGCFTEEAMDPTLKALYHEMVRALTNK